MCNINVSSFVFKRLRFRKQNFQHRKSFRSVWNYFLEIMWLSFVKLLRNLSKIIAEIIPGLPGHFRECSSIPANEKMDEFPVIGNGNSRNLTLICIPLKILYSILFLGFHFLKPEITNTFLPTEIWFSFVFIQKVSCLKVPDFLLFIFSSCLSFNFA